LIPFFAELRQASAIGQATFAIVEKIAAILVAIANKAIRCIKIRRLCFARTAYADRATASQETPKRKSYAGPEASRFILWVNLEV
jgi:hypothetical protein